MSIVDFIAVVSFGLTCFGLGYTFGKDNNKPQKQPPWSDMYPEFWTHKKLNQVHMDASLNFVGGIHFVFA